MLRTAKSRIAAAALAGLAVTSGFAVAEAVSPPSNASTSSVAGGKGHGQVPKCVPIGRGVCIWQ